jgi:thiol-disulfide isomerase/thioredoxin
MKALSILTLLFSSAVIFADESLTIGSKAPPIKVAKWVKGKEIKSGKGGLRVIEFWATWCGPCKESIPHLTELAKKYAGKVDFVGVSVWEQQKDEKDTSYLKLVDDFVTGMGDKMAYNVAVDLPTKVMSTTWMRASGEPGIPSSFLVDQSGTIIWIGHPMDGLDEAIQKAIEGKYDMRAAAEKRQAGIDAQKAELAAFAPLEKLIKEQKFAEALDALDSLVEKNPQYAENGIGYRYQILLNFDEKKLDLFLRAMAAQGKDLGSMYTGALDILNDKSPRKIRDYPLAVLLLEKTTSALPSDNAFVVMWLGEAYARTEAWEKAVDAIQRAIAAGEKDPQTPQELKDQLGKKLAAYKAKKLG